MWVLGVDYGVRRVAVAAIGGMFDTATVTELVLPPKTDDLLALAPLAACLRTQIVAYRPDLVVIEAPWARPASGITVGMRLARVSGALALAATEAGSSVEMVAPKDWKKQVIGFGNANKDQVSEWLRNTHPTFHASCTSQDGIDSICIGLSAQALLAGRR